MITTSIKEIKASPKLIIKNNVWSDFFYLHKKIGNIEWSGILWCDVKGSIENPDKLELTATDFTLRDIGTAAYTESDFGEDIIDLYIDKPELQNKKICWQHTHHSMKSFFSGTDIGALHENAPFHNYYLSCIVNKDGDILAKIAFIGKETGGKLSYKNDKGKWITTESKKEEDILFTIDCEVIIENNQDKDILFYETKNKEKKSISEIGKSLIPQGQFSRFGKQRDFWDDLDFPQVKEDPKYNLKDTITIYDCEEEEFLAKLLTINGDYEGSLDEAIKYSINSIKDMDKDLYLQSMEDSCFEIFNNIVEIKILAEKLEQLKFYQKCCRLLDKYKFDLTTEILQIIKETIIDE